MPDEIDLMKDKWIRVMCDYSAEGLWDRDDCAASVNELPIPDALRQRLLKWQEWHDIHDYNEKPPIEIDWKAFSAEGLAIAREIKKTLPDWTVIYFDEEKSNASWHEGQPRTFEYEITFNPDGSFSP